MKTSVNAFFCSGEKRFQFWPTASMVIPSKSKTLRMISQSFSF